MKHLPRPSLSRLLNNAGSILVLSIWILVFFSVLSAGLYGIISSRLKVTRAFEERNASYYLAQAACVYFQAFRDADKTGYDTLLELGSRHDQTLGRGSFIFTVTDEESKIDINRFGADIIGRLPGMNARLAQIIASSTLRPFQFKEELLLVEGVTPEVYAKCKDFISVFSEGYVNINTASREVLIILGFSEDLARLVTDFRAGADGKEGTEDDGVFETEGEIIEKLRSCGGFSETQEQLLGQFISQHLLAVSSHKFTLDTETQLLGRKLAKYTITLDKEKIRQWSEQ